MTTQLRLLDGGAGPEWVLDERTRELGRQGVAAARAALAEVKMSRAKAAGSERIAS